MSVGWACGMVWVWRYCFDIFGLRAEGLPTTKLLFRDVFGVWVHVNCFGSLKHRFTMVTFWICELLEWELLFGGEIFGLLDSIRDQTRTRKPRKWQVVLTGYDTATDIYKSFGTDHPTDRALLKCRTNASPMNAIAMPKQNPATCSRPSLLPDLVLLVLQHFLAHRLLAIRLELLIDALKLLDFLVRDGILGLEVGAEPALDALHAVWA